MSRKVPYEAGRSVCPVPTCSRFIPSGQLMCAHCWAKVPKSIRKQIDSGKAGRLLIETAIVAAQGTP